jgi:hypothetical protein
LRCFPQRNIETPVGDVPQPSPVATEILQEHQSQIARDLLASASGNFSASCSIAWLSSAIVGFGRSKQLQQIALSPAGRRHQAERFQLLLSVFA